MKHETEVDRIRARLKAKHLQRKTDWVDYFLLFMCVVFIWFSALVVTEAKAHHDEQQARPVVKGWQPPAIPHCDKELWLRIKDGCNDE